MKWPEVKFSDIAEIVTGNTPPKKDIDNYGPGVPWVKPPDLDAWEPVTKTVETLSPKGQKLARILPEGSVMVCCIGSIGRVGIAGTTLTTNQQINSLIFGSKVVPKFGYYYCRLIGDKFRAEARNAVVSILNKTNFSKIKMPLPPLSEQRRIVEILDQADEIRKKRAEADTKAAKIIPALFYKMFGDPVTNPKGLSKKRLGELIKVKSGNFLPAKKMDTEGTYPVYGGNGINGFHSEYMFEKPVIVIGRVGVYCGAVYYSEPNCWITDNALYVAEQSEDLHPLYLSEALRIANLNQYAGRAGQPLISGSRIYPIEVLVPPKILQERYVNLLVNFQQFEKNIQKAIDNIEKLFSVLLHKAFKGDITANWRELYINEILVEEEQQAKQLNLQGYEV